MVSSRFTKGQFCATNMPSRMSLIPTGKLQSLDSQWSSTVSKNVSVSPQCRGLVLSWICQWPWYYPLKRGAVPHKALAPPVFVPHSIKYAIVQEGYFFFFVSLSQYVSGMCFPLASPNAWTSFFIGTGICSRNVGTCVAFYTASFSRILQFSLELQISHCAASALFYIVPVSSSLIFWREFIFWRCFVIQTFRIQIIILYDLNVFRFEVNCVRNTCTCTALTLKKRQQAIPNRLSPYSHISEEWNV